MLGIEADEYERRQAAMRRSAAEAGFQGVVAWSRGGSTQDHYADVAYLTGFYQHQPFVPDVAGRWRAQGHAAVVLPVAGPALLLSGDVPATVPVAVPVAAACPAADLVGELAARLRDTVPYGRVGLIGGEAMSATWWCRLRSLLPGHELVGADELAWRARRIKSPAELALLRAAGTIGARAMEAAMAAAAPGVTEAEVAATAVGEIVRAGGAYYGMGLSSGSLSHTFAAPGRRLGEIARRCQEVLERSAFAARHGLPGSELGGAWGHGLGLSFEPPWLFPMGPYAEQRVEPGMCLAVERRIAMPSVGGAGYEDVVIVTEDGAKVVT